MSQENKVRIQKYLSENGVASRRKSEQMILEGLIKINGKNAQIGDKIDPTKDKVYVNNKLIEKNTESKRYIMLNKPRGYITTMSDERGRKCVASLFPGVKERIYPIGRLDKDSEGLLLMTNDGELANSIMHPSRHVEKTYRVTVRPGIKDYQIAKLCEGVRIDGYVTAPAKVQVICEEPGRVVLEITIHEGKNRQIRKMCEAVGLEVARLKRLSVGGLKLLGLPVGKWRDLKSAEIEKLKTKVKNKDLNK